MTNEYSNNTLNLHLIEYLKKMHGYLENSDDAFILIFQFKQQKHNKAYELR